MNICPKNLKLYIWYSGILVYLVLHAEPEHPKTVYRKFLNSVRIQGAIFEDLKSEMTKIDESKRKRSSPALGPVLGLRSY